MILQNPLIWFGKGITLFISNTNFISCPCRQLTIRETVGDAGGRENSEAGYVHRLDFKPQGLFLGAGICFHFHSWFG